MFPVPAGVGVRRKDYGVIVLPVGRQNFAVHVLRNFLMERRVKPGFVKEHAANEPYPGCKAQEEYQSVKLFEVHHYGADYSHPPRIRYAAYAGTGRNEELLFHGFDADAFEFACHKVGEFLFAFRPRQTGPDVVCGGFDNAESLVRIGFEFFSHISSICPTDGRTDCLYFPSVPLFAERLGNATGVSDGRTDGFMLRNVIYL